MCKVLRFVQLYFKRSMEKKVICFHTHELPTYKFSFLPDLENKKIDLEKMK